MEALALRKMLSFRLDLSSVEMLRSMVVEDGQTMTAFVESLIRLEYRYRERQKHAVSTQNLAAVQQKTGSVG